MRIQVMGATGMLGKAVMEMARLTGMDVAYLTVDIKNVRPEDIESDVVINCSGVTQLHSDPSHQEMFHVNTLGARSLARACDIAGARMVHVSTDTLFKRPGPHDETHEPDCLDTYALSKFAGEITYEPHATLRLAFVGIGRYGICADVIAGTRIRASDKLRQNVMTVQTAASLLLAVAQRPDVSGLLHVPAQHLTRFQLVAVVCHMAGVNPMDVILQDNTLEADRRLCSRRWADLGLPAVPILKDQFAVLWPQLKTARENYLAREKERAEAAKRPPEPRRPKTSSRRS